MKVFMPTFVLAAVVTVLLLCFGGCGAPGPPEVIPDSVVIRQVGDFITDVWVLRGQHPSWNGNRDYWQFADADGNEICVDPTGVKVIEVWDRNDLEKYHEYHVEFEVEPYWYLYNMEPA